MQHHSNTLKGSAHGAMPELWGGRTRQRKILSVLRDCPTATPHVARTPHACFLALGAAAHGDGNGRRGDDTGEPQVGPPMTPTQVAISVGAILLFLLFVVLIGHSGFHSARKSEPAAIATKTPPLLGAKGEEVKVGKTVWGVAFTDQVDRVNGKLPQLGQFYMVGVVVGNQGHGIITLEKASVGLLDETTGKRYAVRTVVWGTPRQISAGQYTSRYALPPRRAVAGLVVFDAPKTLVKPRLLVRDLTASSTAYTGMIDLTREGRHGT